jgi:hypothetical protein
VLEGFHVVNAVVVFALTAILGLGAWRISAPARAGASATR